MMLKMFGLFLLVAMFATPAFAAPTKKEIEFLKARTNAVNVVFGKMKTYKGFLRACQKIKPQHPLYKNLLKNVQDQPLPKFSVNSKDGTVNIEGLPHSFKVRAESVTYNGKTTTLKGKTWERQIVDMIGLISNSKKSKAASVLSLMPEAHAEASIQYKSFLDKNYDISEDDINSNSNSIFLANEGSDLFGSTAAIVLSAAVATGGLVIMGTSGWSGVGAVVGGVMALGGGAVLLLTVSGGAEAATPERIACTLPLGSFEIQSTVEGSSVTASFKVDETQRPISVSMSGRGSQLECPVRPTTKTSQMLFWTNEETIWEAKCSNSEIGLDKVASMKSMSEACAKVGKDVMNTALNAVVGGGDPAAPESSSNGVVN